jgi:hypothetical protein
MSSALYGRPDGPLRVVSEKPEVNGWRIVCCGYCSGQMAARHVKPGTVSTQMESATQSAHRARALKGRPHNNGANATEVREGTYNAMGVRMVAASMSGVLSALKAGRAAVYNHEYGALPAYLRNQSGSFGHSAALCYYKRSGGVDYVGWYDPLAAQGSQGIWAKWSDLQRAAWGGSAHSVTTAGAPQPPTVPVPPDPLPEPLPPVEPPTDPQPPDPPPSVNLPPARVWVLPSPLWGLVAWPALPIVIPGPAPAPATVTSWWCRTEWQPSGQSLWGGSPWQLAVWSRGRW